MSELEQWLEASVGGDIVSKYTLPTETDLHAVHAQLSRGCRESKRFSLVEVKRKDDDDGE